MARVCWQTAEYSVGCTLRRGNCLEGEFCGCVQATFTFVVRSFTVLDGIGKCLDPRFDISEISAPYARELLLECRPQVAKLRSELGKRLALQARARPCLLAPREHVAMALIMCEVFIKLHELGKRPTLHGRAWPPSGLHL